jgi:hypothetical protein
MIWIVLTLALMCAGLLAYIAAQPPAPDMKAFESRIESAELAHQFIRQQGLRDAWAHWYINRSRPRKNWAELELAEWRVRELIAA